VSGFLLQLEPLPGDARVSAPQHLVVDGLAARREEDVPQHRQRRPEGLLRRVQAVRVGDQPRVPAAVEHHVAGHAGAVLVGIGEQEGPGQDAVAGDLEDRLRIGRRLHDAGDGKGVPLDVRSVEVGVGHGGDRAAADEREIEAEQVESIDSAPIWLMSVDVISAIWVTDRLSGTSVSVGSSPASPATGTVMLPTVTDVVATVSTVAGVSVSGTSFLVVSRMMTGSPGESWEVSVSRFTVTRNWLFSIGTLLMGGGSLEDSKGTVGLITAVGFCAWTSAGAIGSGIPTAVASSTSL
jgi:hypothetical protein